MIHEGRDFLAEDESVKFPAVRRTLWSWGCLSRAATLGGIEQLNVRVKKVTAERATPGGDRGLLDRRRTDRIVLATEGREGLPAWLRPSVPSASRARRTS